MVAETPSLENKLEPTSFFMDQEDGTWNLSMPGAKAWSEATGQQFDGLPDLIRLKIVAAVSEEASSAFRDSDARLKQNSENRYLKREIKFLVDALRDSNMLPAICFHNSRHGCYVLASTLYQQLKELDQKARQESGEAHRKAQLKRRLEELDGLIAKANIAKNSRLEGNVRLVSSTVLSLIEERKEVISTLESMAEMNPAYTVRVPGGKALSRSELTEELEGVPDPNLDHYVLFLRGIGFHHAGLPTAYRRAVERLFRTRRLAIIISTSTLAVGINMPSRTSVFLGDSDYLDVMQYHQEAGRAGRRGFDLRGHTVFLGIRKEKVQLLLRSELPPLVTDGALTASFVLRLLIKDHIMVKRLAEGSANFDAADIEQFRKSVTRSINNTYYGCTNSLMKSLQATSFLACIDHFCSEGLLSKSDLQPTSFAGFAAHLFWTEPGCFAFIPLASSKLVQEMSEMSRDEFVTVLCHIFSTISLHPLLMKKSCLRGGPSLVCLPPLPKSVRTALEAHTQRSLRRHVGHWKNFVEHFSEDLGPDDTLPLTGTRFTAFKGAHRKLRSSFISMSGHDDNFRSFEELRSTCRSGLDFDAQLFPALDMSHTNDMTWNAYLLDFYKHGQLKALERYNGIPRSEVYEHLENFSQTLKALAAASHRRCSMKDAQPAMLPFSNLLSAVSLDFESKKQGAGHFNQLPTA